MKKLFLLILLFNACNSKVELENQGNLEQEVYNKIFPSIVDTLRYKVIWGIGFENLSQSEVRSKIYKDKLDVFIDTILSVPNIRDFDYSNLEWLRKVTKNDSLIELARKFRGINSENLVLKIHELDNGNRYKLLPIKRGSFNKKYPGRLGIITLSRIIFNDSRDFGCFYMSFYNKGDNAIGQLIAIEKVNNDWLIKERIDLWES